MSCHTHRQVHTSFLSARGLLNYKTPDLKADNLLVGFEVSSVIEDLFRQQKDGIPLYKEVDGNPIYQTREPTLVA